MIIVDKITARLSFDSNGCWIWRGAKTRKGYGRVSINGRGFYTHRLMFEAKNGQIPQGKQIDHVCRNTSCCNPDHLEAVTPAENTRRGRSPALSRARGGQKTHCPHGHSFTDDNVYRLKNGARACVECRRRRHVEWTEKRRSYRTFTAQGGNVASIARGLKS